MLDTRAYAAHWQQAGVPFVHFKPADANNMPEPQARKEGATASHVIDIDDCSEASAETEEGVDAHP